MTKANYDTDTAELPKLALNLAMHGFMVETFAAGAHNVESVWVGGVKAS